MSLRRPQFCVQPANLSERTAVLENCLRACKIAQQVSLTVGSDPTTRWQHTPSSAATQQHSNAAFPPTCWRSRDLQQKTSEFHGMTMEASKWGLSSHDLPWTSSPNTMSASRAHMSSLRECHFGEKMSYLTCWLWLNLLRKFRETFVQRGLFVLKSFWLCV